MTQTSHLYKIRGGHHLRNSSLAAQPELYQRIAMSVSALQSSLFHWIRILCLHRCLKAALSPVYRAKFMTALVVFAWFCSNIGLLLMNKFLLSNYGFKQPVFLTLCHMLACVILSTAFSSTQYVPKKSIQSSKQLIKVSLLAAVFAMSVVLGNVSLRFIPVSFSQVCFCIVHHSACRMICRSGFASSG